MKRLALVLLCLSTFACSKKTTTEESPAASVSARAIVPANGCPTALADDVGPCEGMLGGKLDKYTWNVTVASTWEVNVTQPKEVGGFRPVLIVWKEPDKTIVQDDTGMIGAKAHVSTKLEPGSYRISIVNGNPENKMVVPRADEAFPYTLSITHAK